MFIKEYSENNDLIDTCENSNFTNSLSLLCYSRWKKSLLSILLLALLISIRYFSIFLSFWRLLTSLRLFLCKLLLILEWPESLWTKILSISTDFFFFNQQFITQGMMVVHAYKRNYVWSINTLTFFYAVTQYKRLLRNWTHNLK